MSPRIEAALAGLTASPPRLATALRASLGEGYGPAALRADLLAGLVVGVVALPLSMALAIASGVPPAHGLYTAIVAGGLIALLGGSRVQVSGPTAAFVVLLAPVSAQYGLGGLLLASCLAGALLVAMGLARFGRLITFIPHPVVTGFTAGVAAVIASLQVKDFLGLDPAAVAADVGRWRSLWDALPTLRWPDLTVGLVTLGVLAAWPRVARRVPAQLVGLVAGALAAWALGALVPDATVATLGGRFGELPSSLPRPGLPWEAAGPGGAPLGLSWDTVRALLPSAFAIALLGAIESLLSAVVADGMTGRRHDPDGELVAQGLGNLVAPFFGGIAATGALARTALNVRAGARSPLAAAVHAGVVLVAVLALAPLLGRLPMASLAALLLVVAWNMAEVRHVAHVLRVAPRSDGFVLLTCFGLTVAFDMVVAVGVGVVLAALLFMRRMADVAGVRLVGAPHRVAGPLPDDVLVYEVAGPLFFGAAQKAVAALEGVADGTRRVVLDLQDVPVMDATGLVNLESTLARLERRGVEVVLCGVRPQPRAVLDRARVTERVRLAAGVAEALSGPGAAPAGDVPLAAPAAAAVA